MLGDTLIEEDATAHTGIRSFVYDSDEVSAYPKATSTCNVSKTTTKREIINIDGIDEYMFRRQNLNILVGDTNALSYGQNMFALPKPTDLLAEFKTSMNC